MKSQKTLIGVLASHDDQQTNVALASLFTHFYERSAEKKEKLDGFHFVITGGTYDRLFFGEAKSKVPPLDPEVAVWLKGRATPLPSFEEGGVIILSHLVTQHKCSIVWPFQAPMKPHWTRPENLAFMRLCDQWHVKRLMNRGSVVVWYELEADLDDKRNLQPCPPSIILEVAQGKFESFHFEARKPKKKFKKQLKPLRWHPKKREFSEMTIALIAHDEMKNQMIEFAIDHEAELKKFGTILSTSTTGREVAAATSRAIDGKIVRYHTGPKGGDIEIATAILCKKCDVVIFFVDPLHPHPHIEDIRTVFQAAMINDQVVMITNEMHAREFMSRVVRGNNNSLTLYPLTP